MKKAIIIISLFSSAFYANAQDVLTPAQYVEMYKDLAVREMKRMGVPAAITLAQGILETESGNSALVKKSNNHFGIKCKSSWTAESVTHDDDAKGECFRSYKSAEDSYRDHSNFLRGNDRYSFLFSLDVRDYKAWAYGLKKAGYATNPQYPQILIKHIEQYNLQQYTLQGADDVPQFNASRYQDDKSVPLEDEKTKNETVISDPSSQTMLDVSDKVLIVNGSKCIYAGKGTSLLVVATKNDIPLAKLLSFNELAEDGMLAKNQYVYLEKKSKTGDKDFYITKQNETFYDICQANGIQLQPMLDYNKLWGNEDIKPGTKIYLKPGLFQKQINNSPEPVKKIVTHIVQPKEGLYAISKKYNVTVQQLKEWNKLETDALSIGQELIVSQ